METLSNLKRNIFRQYVLETLIEEYNEADSDSYKYFIKLQLIEFVESDRNFSIKNFIDYMSLNYDKFEPFILTLKNVSNKRTKSNKYTKKSNLFSNKTITLQS